MSTVPFYNWSFSSLGLTECPKRYEIVRAKKLVQSAPSKAGDEGARLHELIEKYIRDDVWDNELGKWKKLLDVYKAKGGVVEAEYAFKWVIDVGTEDKHLVRCKADDPEAWYRGYIDWMKIDGENCEIVDWKTGKVKVTKQLQLYAWIVMTAHPEINHVKCTFHFINVPDQINEFFHRKDMDKLFRYFQDKLDEIDNWYRTETWPEVPGDIQKSTGRGAHCRFCEVTNQYCSHGKSV